MPQVAEELPKEICKEVSFTNVQHAESADPFIWFGSLKTNHTPTNPPAHSQLLLLKMISTVLKVLYASPHPEIPIPSNITFSTTVQPPFDMAFLLLLLALEL